MELHISPEDSGKTVREVLLSRLHPSKKLYAALKYGQGRLMCNGIFVRVGCRLKTGDVLQVVLSDDFGSGLAPWDTTLGVLYEDDAVVIVDKPAGMPCHPSPGHHENQTLANALTHRYGTGFTFRPIGRLDIGTSGCMMAAKNKYTAAQLDRMKRRGEIRKYYLLLTEGNLPKTGDILRSVLKPSPNGLRMMATTGNDGLAAASAYQLLYKTNGVSVVLAQTLTGRMHQLRAQFAGIGCPLIGDTAYGACPCPALGRQALHAYAMSFVPQNGKAYITVKCPVPDDMKQWITEEPKTIMLSQEREDPTYGDCTN